MSKIKNYNKKKLFLLLFLFLIITPLGLLTSSPAWGEWEKNYFSRTLGFIPEGIKQSSNLLKAPFADYRIFNNKLLSQFLSALIALLIIWLFFKLLHFLLSNKRK